MDRPWGQLSGERKKSVSSLSALIYLGTINAKRPQGGSRRREQVHRLMVCWTVRTLSFWGRGQEAFTKEQSRIHHREQARDSVGVFPLLTSLIRTIFPLTRQQSGTQAGRKLNLFKSLIFLSFWGTTKLQSPAGTTSTAYIAYTTKAAKARVPESRKTCFFRSLGYLSRPCQWPCPRDDKVLGPRRLVSLLRSKRRKRNSSEFARLYLQQLF